jgi:septal ring factor EnvC (AmiA/AmiB activator)
MPYELEQDLHTVLDKFRPYNNKIRDSREFFRISIDMVNHIISVIEYNTEYYTEGLVQTRHVGVVERTKVERQLNDIFMDVPEDKRTIEEYWNQNINDKKELEQRCNQLEQFNKQLEQSNKESSQLNKQLAQSYMQLSAQLAQLLQTNTQLSMQLAQSCMS